MTEFDPVKNSETKVEDIYQFHKTLKSMGESPPKPHNGMKMFEVSFDTYKAKEAKYKASSIPMKSKAGNLALATQNALVSEQIHHQLIFNNRMWYVWAINADNAERKFKKYLKFLKRMQELMKSKH